MSTCAVAATAVTATRLFDMLKLKVNMKTISQEVALEKLRRGRKSGTGFVAGSQPRCSRGFQQGRAKTVAIPFNPAIRALYAPTRLTSADYPALALPIKPVDTIAVGAVLVRRRSAVCPGALSHVANFVEAFFHRLESLLTPGHHAKWREVTLAPTCRDGGAMGLRPQWLQRNIARRGGPEPARMSS